MADVITLDLELIDKVGGPAKRAADALRRIEEQQKRAQAAVDKTTQRFADSWAKIGMKSAKDQQRAIALTQRAQARASAQMIRNKAKEEAALRRVTLAHMQANKMNEKFDAAKKGGFFASFRQALPFRSIGDYAKGAFWGHMAAEGVSKIVGGFVAGARKAVELVASGIEKAFHYGARGEARRLGLELTLGKSGARAFEADAERMSGLTPFSGIQIADIMSRLNQAGLKGSAGRTAFALAGDIAASQGRGADEHAVSEIADQIANVKLGGTIDKQHLRALGLNFKDFYGSLGKKLGTSAEDVQKRASEGRLDPQLLINEMAAQIEKRQGGKLGSGMQRASRTMEAQLGRLASLPEVYLSRISKSPEWAKLSVRLEDMLHQLSPNGPKGQRIIASMIRAFERMADLIQRALTPENIDRFVDGVEKAFEYATKLPEIFNQIVGAAKTVALIWAAMKILPSGGDGKKPVVDAAKSAADAAGKALGVGAGAVAIAATAAVMSEPDRQGAWMDEENDRLVKQGKRRAVDHWYGTTYEDVPVGQQSQVTVSGNTINVYPPEGADPKDVADQVGQSLASETQKAQQRALERAAMEAGGR